MGAAVAGRRARAPRRHEHLATHYSVAIHRVKTLATRDLGRLGRVGVNALSMDPKPIEPHATATADRVAVSRTLRFTAGFPPGDYQIEVTVMDAEGTGRRRSATQWSDFSVVARGPASALCASTAAVVDTFCRASDGRFHPVRGVRHFEHAPSRG